MEMSRPGAISLVLRKMVCPHHFSSRSGVGGRLPMKGAIKVGVSTDWTLK